MYVPGFSFSFSSVSVNKRRVALVLIVVVTMRHTVSHMCMTRVWYAASGVCALVGSCVFKRGRARVCVEDNFKNKLAKHKKQ